MPERDPLSLLPFDAQTVEAELSAISYPTTNEIAELMIGAIESGRKYTASNLQFHSIGVLSHEENIKIGTRIQKLRTRVIKLANDLSDGHAVSYLRELDLRNTPKLSPASLFKDMVVEIRKEAIKLAVGNWRLIPTTFKALILNQSIYTQEDLQDIFQEGFIALLNAGERFDPHMGYTFSTLAVHYIKGAILGYRPNFCEYSINKADADRYRIYKTIQHLAYATTKQTNTPFEFIAAGVFLHFKNYRSGRKSMPSYEEIENYFEEARATKGSEEKFLKRTKVLGNLVAVIENVTSLDEKRKIQYKDESGEIGIFFTPTSEKLTDPTPTPEDQTLLSERRRLLSELMQERLTERQRKILYFRFVNDFTFEQVGQRIGLSRERIRQIEHEAIRRLRTTIYQNERYDSLKPTL